MGKSSHERVHEWGQDRTAAEKDQPREHQQEDHQRNQPPFLFLLQEKEKLFEELPHDRHSLLSPLSRSKPNLFSLLPLAKFVRGEGGIEPFLVRRIPLGIDAVGG